MQGRPVRKRERERERERDHEGRKPFGVRDEAFITKGRHRMGEELSRVSLLLVDVNCIKDAGSTC